MLKYSCSENTMQSIEKLSYIVIIGMMKGKPAILSENCGS